MTEQAKFISDFNSEHDEDIREVLLVKLLLPQSNIFGLHENEIWGLLLFGKSLYFHAPAQSASLLTFFRTVPTQNKDILICLSDYEIKNVLPIKKSFFASLFSAENEISLTLSKSENQTMTITIVSPENPEILSQKLGAFIKTSNLS